MEADHAQLLSVEQVAEFCGLSRKAIYRAIERGELRATKRCSRWRVWREDLDSWLDDGVRPASGRGGVDARSAARRQLRAVASDNC